MKHDARDLSRLYHISPEINDDRILSEGIDPAESKTRVPRAYAVEYDLLPWAFAHVSARHGVPVSLLSVWTVPFDARWRRWRGKVWYTSEAISADKLNETQTRLLAEFV